MVALGGVDCGSRGLFRVHVKEKGAMRRNYYWLVCRDEQGKSYLVFGGDDESEARQKGLEMLGGIDFEIKRYPTRDKDTASAYYRGVRLEQGEGLSKARQRIGHEKSIKRLRRRSMTYGN